RAMIRLDAIVVSPSTSLLILGVSKDERLAQDRLSNHEPSRRLVLRQAQDERCAGASIARQTSRWRPSSSDVDSPLILSLSKDERLAQDSPVEPRAIPAARPSTGSGRAIGRSVKVASLVVGATSPPE